MTYSTEFTVRFGEIDPARVVYYPRFFHYFHQAFESWFENALGVPYGKVLEDHNIGFPSVHVETDFKRPLRYGEKVRIDIDLLEIGKRSITLLYTAVRLPDGKVSAVSTIKTAAIRNDTFKSVDIPDDWRERFEEFKSGQR